MTMRGMLHIPILRNGNLLSKGTAIVIILSVILCGCAGGQGDWSKDLYNGYSITRFNSDTIMLINDDQPVTPYAIMCFYITEYQLHEPYIFLKGIQTKHQAITEEERDNNSITYYIVHTETDEIIGPIDSFDAFIKQCNQLSLVVTKDEGWTKTE